MDVLKTTNQKPQTLVSVPPKPTADFSSKTVPNQDSDMLGEYPPPFLPTPFQSINGLLPPKQNTPENISGEFRVQNSRRTTIIHFNGTSQHILPLKEYNILTQVKFSFTHSNPQSQIN